MADTNNHRTFTWVTLILIVAGAAGFISWRSQQSQPIPAFSVEQRKIVQTVVATGRVVPPETIEIGSLRLGKVTGVSVKEGTHVKGGDLLIHLNDAEPLAAVAQSEARVREAKLKLRNMRRVTSASLRNELDQADLAVQQTQDDFNRIQTLFASGAANQSQLDGVKNKLQSVRRRRDQVALEAGNVGVKGGAYQMAVASLDQAEADLDQHKARLAYSHIHSPVDGLVLEKRVNPGAVVQPGQVLLVLAKTGETTIEVPIDEKNLKGLDVGDHAMASTDAYQNELFHAEVSQLAPAVDRQTGTLMVKLNVPNPPNYLRADMTVSVEIQIEAKQKAIVFPAEAAFTDDADETYVFVAENNTVQKRVIIIGLKGDFLHEARDGLKNKDIVLLPDSDTLRAGQKVNPLVHNFHK